ncbi:MAG: RND transporter [Pseudomonadales bacterium]|nr:RND transporter [Pseudomonadales bacterium]
MSHPLSTWLVRYRLPLFIASVLCLLVAGWGATRLTVKSDYKIFFEPDNPQLVASEMLEDRYSASDNVLLVLNPANGDIFTRKNLVAIEALTEAAWSIPYSQRVDSVTNFQHTAVDGDELLVQDLVQDAANLTDQEIVEKREIAIHEPLLVHRLISPSGHVGAINVQLNLPDDQTAALPEVMAHVRAIRADFKQRYPGLEVMITGITPLNQAFNEMNEKDSSTLIPLMLLVILVLVGVLLRSVAGTAITLVIVIASVLVAVCSMGWMAMPINNINFAAPTIILTLAVADCIHLLTYYLLGLRRGLSQTEALTASLDINIRPVFLTSLTTAVGFLSMQSSDSPPFRELGVVSAIGVLSAFIFTLTMMPQLIMWFSRRAPRVDPERSSRFGKLADFTIRHPRKLFFGSLAVALACIAFVGQNELNDDNFGYFSTDLEVRRAADFTEANLNGVGMIEYSIDSGAPQGINDPEFLRQVDAFVQWYRQQPHVTHVLTFTDTLKRLNQDMNGDDPAYYRLPDSREHASQYQLLYEMSLPFGMDVNNQVDMAKSALRISVSLKGVKAKDILATEARAQQWFAEHAPELAAVGASPSLMFATIGQQNIRSMMKGTVIATIIISLILVFSLGSWKLGLLSIIPNAFPAAIMLGLWGLLVGEVNLAVAVVFGITLGIVVDDTVHFMSKYLRGYEKYGDVAKAIHYSFEHVGAALLTTTVVLSLGFGMLVLSDFNVNAILGTMVSLTIIIALVFDFLFLPPMMQLLARFIHSGNNTAASRSVPPETAASPTGRQRDRSSEMA